MVSIAPTPSVMDVQPAQSAANTAGDNPQREQAQRATEIYQQQLTPDALSVQLDESSQRFVQTITDSGTAAVVLRYPSESQLAYSRAVMAYLRTMCAPVNKK